MHISSQIIRPLRPRPRPRHFLFAACAGLALWALLPACDGTPLEHATQPPPATSPESFTPAAPPPAPGGSRMPAEAPVDSWTYAPSVAAFHQVWYDRFALSTGDTPNAEVLLPYADALTFQGASWGVAPADITILVRRPDDSVYRLRGPAHPTAAVVEAAEQVSPSELAQLGWEEIQSGRGVTHAYRGTSLQVTGPLTTDLTCTRCHAYPEGTWVGAFAYLFSEIADD